MYFFTAEGGEGFHITTSLILLIVYIFSIFRAMKTKTATPKYGIIYHSTFIGRAGRQFKGRASRFLSNKLSIASRIDAFAGIIVGNSLFVYLKYTCILMYSVLQIILVIYLVRK